MTNWIVRCKVDLSKPESVRPVTDFGYCLVGDKKAHSWEIFCFNGSEKANLSGYNVIGYFIRSDKKTVYIEGRVEDSCAICVLDETCYQIEGDLRGALKLENPNTGEIITIGVMYARIKKSTTDSVVDPGNIIPSISDLLTEFSKVDSAIERANSASEVLENLTVTATLLPPTSQPTASYANGNLAFGIPKGDKGDRAYTITVVGSTFSIQEGD